MRIDKFLKVSRLIKRRSVANDACSGNRVLINSTVSKPGDKVKIGDIIEILLGDRTIKAEVMSLAEHTSKDDATSLYRIIE